MRNAILLALALVAGLAHAQGVPLLSARQATAADRPALAKLGASAKAVTINRYAIDSNAITVMLDGKEHRFVGTKTVRQVEESSDAGVKITSIDSWYGTTNDGNGYMTLTRGSVLMGSIHVANGSYELKQNLLIRTGAAK